jgi:hypothetical protein
VHAFVLRKVRYEMVDRAHDELTAIKDGLFGESLTHAKPSQK